MRLTFRDGVATILVAAIGVPYIGYLIRGSMPFIQDPRGMAGTGLVLGVAAFLVLGLPNLATRLGKVELVLEVTALTAGVAAVAFAETAAADTLLAVFMALIAAVWAVDILDHAGLMSTGPVQRTS
jgi:hypothetical protein